MFFCLSIDRHVPPLRPLFAAKRTRYENSNRDSPMTQRFDDDNFFLRRIGLSAFGSSFLFIRMVKLSTCDGTENGRFIDSVHLRAITCNLRRKGIFIENDLSAHSGGKYSRWIPSHCSSSFSSLSMTNSIVAKARRRFSLRQRRHTRVLQLRTRPSSF